MKKRYIYIVLFGFLLFSCATTKTINTKKVVYKSKFLTESIEKPFEERAYSFYLPKGFKKDDNDFNSEYNEVVFKYPNDVIFYITDNAIGGSSLNGNNKLNEGITSIIREKENDSLYLKGKQKDGKFWKENILNDIVIGYLNVSKEDKEKFDKAISTLKRDK